MLFLTPSDIAIGDNRQRKEFQPQELADLTNSIQAIGLLHPLVVRHDLNTGRYMLVAGERRMRAILTIYDTFAEQIKCAGQFVPEGKLPCLDLGELSPLEAEEAELDENIKRVDLTWQEHAAALDRLHKFRQRQAAAANSTQPYSVTDLALEVTGRPDGSYRAAIRQELIVAQHLNNPEVVKAKTIKDAFKVVVAQEERKKNEQLAAVVGCSLSASSHIILQGNSLELLADPIYHDRFDVICSDPPYGINAHKFGDAAGRLSTIQHHYEDTYENWLLFMRDFIQRSISITKSQAHMYLFCDVDRFSELRELCQAVGWYVFRTPLVYVKTGGGRVPLPEMGPRRCYELILYAIKGKKPVTHIYPDVIQAAADANESHGAQKSVAVFQNLLQRSCNPGNEVLDPCAGTGTLALAAHALKCKATCIEQSAEYYGIACKRVKELDS